MEKTIMVFIAALLILSITSTVYSQYHENGEQGTDSTNELVIITTAGDNTNVIIDGMQMPTDVYVQENSNVVLSDGGNSTIEVSPRVALAAAVTEFGEESCYEGCTIELKEREHGGETKVAYHVNAKKEYKLLGLFKTTADVSADVDAKTGEVIGTDKPFWTFVSTEVKAEADTTETTGEGNGGY